MMKKSQILAAIALAMALGVVAPVVSVSAVTEDKSGENAVVGSATKAEANAFKASVEGSAQYKALDALQAEIDKAPAAADQSETTIAGNIKTAYNNVVPAKDQITTSVTLDEAVRFATGLDKYAAHAKAVHAVADLAAGAISKQAAVSELEAAYEGITGEEYAYAAGVDTSGVDAKYNALTSTTAGDDSVMNTTGYNNWKTLVNNTDKGIKLQKLTESLKGALKVVNRDVQVVKDIDSKNYADLLAAANAVMGGHQGEAYTALKEFFDDDFKTFDDSTKAGQEGIYADLKEQLPNVEALYNAKVGSLTVSAIVAGYKAPINPAAPADKDDVNAPATGIAGTAEGTATTVSIVAGLATALTALGAGVVAYRSARRK